MLLFDFSLCYYTALVSLELCFFRLHNSPDVTPVEPNKPVLPTLKEDKQSNKSTENSNALIDLTGIIIT